MWKISSLMLPLQLPPAARTWNWHRKILDYGYSEAGHNLFNFGIEGVSYEMKDGRAEYTDVVTNNPDGWPFAQSLAKYIRANYNGPFIQDLNYP